MHYVSMVYVTVDGRRMTLAEWVGSVEHRLMLHGMTLDDLDERTVRE